jgi:hypothetical protein
MCYGVLGSLFSFGNCNKPNYNAEYAIDINRFQSDIRNSISRTNQESNNNIGGSQIQVVTINGYTSGAPDIIATQRMNINVASNTKLASVITDKMLIDAGESIISQMDEQLEELAKQNDRVKSKENQDIIMTIKDQIMNIYKSESSKNAIQTKLSSTIGVQQQNIVINFADGVSEKIVSSPNIVKDTFYDGRPVIEIDQNMVNEILIETLMSSIIGEIVNNSELQKLTYELEENLQNPTLPGGLAGVANSPASQNLIDEGNENKDKKKGRKLFLFIGIIFLFFLIFFFTTR